jgi:hypothetical protein
VLGASPVKAEGRATVAAFYKSNEKKKKGLTFSDVVAHVLNPIKRRGATPRVSKVTFYNLDF